MISLFKITIKIFFIILILNNNLIAQNNTKIIAKVGSEIVTSFELENKIKTTLFLAGENLSQKNINSIKNVSMTSLINLKLKREELKKYNFKNDHFERTKNHLKIVSSKLNINTDELENLFEKNKIDYNEYLNEIKTEFSWQNLIFRIYSKKINIDEKQILNELNSVVKEQKNIEEFNLSEIEVNFVNLEEKNKIIDDIRNHIEKYGFAKSANKFSISNTSLDGGKLGWTNSNSLSKSVYESIIKIDVGEYTLITSGNNILFLKLNSKRYKENLNNLETEKLKNSIINKQKTDLLNLYSNTHLSLKKNNTLIEIK
ncbi:MAG: hypothetical protein CBD09_01665 [Puniceicoccaceae bacterium TMED149]|nr:MAG: hypothetical protein CBD09_01665 [Puniceicoccaceae bacterium TMED149]